MPRNLWPAREERAASEEHHVAANRAHDRVRRCDVRQRAQDTTDDQAHEGQQRRPTWNSKQPLCHTKPRRETREALRRKMLCRLTLELSGGVAVRLERVVRPHHAPLVRGLRVSRAQLLEMHRKMLATRVARMALKKMSGIARRVDRLCKTSVATRKPTEGQEACARALHEAASHRCTKPKVPPRQRRLHTTKPIYERSFSLRPNAGVKRRAAFRASAWTTG